MLNILKILLPLTFLLICSCSGDLDNFKQDGPVICPGLDILTVPLAPPSEISAPLSDISENSVYGTNSFAVNLYLRSSLETNDNVCISPFSVENVLGMLANGDDGESRDEILDALGFEKGEEGLASMNEYYRTLLSNLPNLDDTSCIFTNSLWCDPYIPIYSDFNNTISKYFYAVNIGFDPTGETGKAAINQFVKTNTRGLIENFLETPLQATIALLNTAYFKGEWKIPFEKELNAVKDFANIDYSSSKVTFMNALTECEYARIEDGTEAIRVPYGKNGNNFSMTLILPSALINHIALDEALCGENLQDLRANFKKETITLSLPKFEIEYKNDQMVDLLHQLGIEKTFNPDFGFNKIVDYSLPFYLNCYIHASKIIVDEGGTESASASIGGGNGNRVMTFDRPFVFLIQENTTGAIIFIGSVKNL